MNGVDCSGLCIGHVDVPAFHSPPGAIVKLVFPRELAEQIDRIANGLCHDPSGHVRANGSIVKLELPMTRSRLREAIHRQTTAECLVARTGMGPSDACTQLKRLSVNPDAPLSTLALNPRWLIGFLAAMHERPAAIVFATVGLDPLGIQKALATANEGLADAAGIYLTSFSNIGGINEPEYAAVHRVTATELSPVT